MILALLLSIAWDVYPPQSPPGGAEFLEATAWEVAPVVLPCPEPDVGDCLVGYVETWREVQQLPLTATQATWTAPELVSLGVAFMTVRAGRNLPGGGVCWSEGP